MVARACLGLRKQHVVSYPHIGIKSHVHAAAFYEFIRSQYYTVGATLCGRPFFSATQKGMLKNSGTQEKNKQYYCNTNPSVLFILK